MLPSQMRHRRPRRAAEPAPSRVLIPLAALIAATLALKLAVLQQLSGHVLVQPDAGLDTTTYVGLAERVAGGDVTLGPGLYFVSPLYIYFVAAILSVLHTFTAVRIVQIALGTAGVAFVYIAAAEWFGRRAAFAAAVLYTLTGIFTFYESLLIQSALDPALTAAALACLAVGLKRSNRRGIALAGFVLGVQSSNRPNVAIPAAAIFVLLAATRRLSLAIRLALGFAVALAPLALRNAAVADDWSPLPSHGGLNFYIGNNGAATGAYVAVPGITANLEGQQEDARKVA